MDSPADFVLPQPSPDATPASNIQQERAIEDMENDSSRPWARSRASWKTSPEEGDTCRICRGEGTLAEPLFYPCKCSGSIKFVHQECLMEWLSHSQKKHCELCKTSFRFTKLYDSSMPSHLPTLVFARKAALHLFQALVIWIRGFVVAGVWLLWLPWSMRFVWWGLFWLGDGGWSRELEKIRNGTDGESSNIPSFSRPSSRDVANPATTTPLHRNASTSTYNRLSSMLVGATSALLKSPITILQHAFGIFRSEPGTLDDVSLTNATMTFDNSTSTRTPSPDQGSLLAYVSFFRDLTPNPAVNKFVIDIIEGLIITLAVVTASILVFLIREWVVQQPALNFGHQADDVAQADIAADRAADVERDQEENERLEETRPLHENDHREPRDDYSPDNDSQPEVQSQVEQSGEVDLTFRGILQLMREIRKNKEVFDAIGENARTVRAKEFSEAKELIKQTQVALNKLRIASRTALVNGDIVEARSTLKKLEILHESVEYFPWKDDAEREEIVKNCNDFITPAKLLLSRQQEYNMSNVLGESSHKIASSDDDEKRESLDSNTRALQVRPLMAKRTRSQPAADIHKDLKEASDIIERPNELFSAKSIQSSSSNETSEDWQDVIPVESDNSENIPVRIAQPTMSLDAAAEAMPRARELTPTRTLVDEALNSKASSSANAQPLDMNSTFSDNAPKDEVALPNGTSSAQPWETHFSTERVEPRPTTETEGGPASEGDAVPPNNETNAYDLEIINGQHETPNQDNVAPTRSLHERILDWIFDDPSLGGADMRETGTGNEEHVVRDLANEAPFVPFIDAHPQNRAVHLDAGRVNRDPEDAAEAPAQPAGNANDAEVAEDAEDLEGVWELIGMQGPITGVLQNAVFCAVFMAAAVTSAVWFPYLVGKLVLLILANPLQTVIIIPLRTISGYTNFAIDLALFCCCTALFWLDFLLRSLLSPVAWLVPALQTIINSKRFGSVLVRVVESALSRMSRAIIVLGGGSDQSQTTFSMSSLLALRLVQAQVKSSLASLGDVMTSSYHYAKSTAFHTIYQDDIRRLGKVLFAFISKTMKYCAMTTARISSAVRSGELSLTININHGPNPHTSEADLIWWTPMDRLIAVLAGYAFFALLAVLYLKRGSPFSTSPQGKKVERVVTEMLQQAGGVMKVILIISIEMILFPLYCGLLLDLAMLPLFHSTFRSRIEFTTSAPWTSAFIHWFLGTCYMFHFALFVAMCRTIFRSGVLYFIRDPDDPTFHPVRDVLDRSVSSQLRKIGFSALVYGGLVMICMGSVVWTIAIVVKDAFPVRWASNSPLLGFPVDLLLYNLFAPFALQFFKPSKGLRRLYEGWFRFCASHLRLTAFLFGEDNDEQGETKKSKPNAEVGKDGKYVRVPASDQVRIPKGHRVFLEVDEENRRVDGLADVDEGVHGKSNPQFTTVWIPPWYRLRIALFSVFIWMLTAFLGLSVTILPLLTGRLVLSWIAPNSRNINDVYAFSTGFCSITIVIFLAFKIRQWRQSLKLTDLFGLSMIISASKTLQTFAVKAFRVVYTYSSLLILVPALMALLIEFYFIMPLHTYTAVSKSRTAHESSTIPPTTHTLFFLQDCTLGLLYLRVLLRLLLWNANSRPAQALHAVVANGWLNPNIRVATRCFILPFTAATLLALSLPSGFAYVASKALPFVLARLNRTALAHMAPFPSLTRTITALDPDAFRIYMIRFSYPSCLFVAATAWLALAIVRATGKWRNKIRDEVYLIGERLHNFAERRPPTPAPPQSRRIAVR